MDRYVMDSIQILVLVETFIEFIEVTTAYKPPGRLADETNKRSSNTKP